MLHREQGEHIIRSQQTLITSVSHHHRAPHAQGCLPRAQLMLTTCHTPNRLPHTIHHAPAGTLFKKEGMLLRPVAQLYGQVRTDWNQCFVIDCSLSHPAGHKPFTCSHSVLRNTWLNIHDVRWCVFLLAFLCMYLRSRRTLLDLFSSVVPWASCRVPDPLTVFCDMFAAVWS